MNSYLSLVVNNRYCFILAHVTLLSSLSLLNILIPSFCYHIYLPLAGNCRMCLVQLYEINNLVVSCCLLLNSNGVVVYTTNSRVLEVSQSVLEFLLINHPLDCPTCDQGGECDLQDWMFLLGAEGGRFLELVNNVVTLDFILYGLNVELDNCIQCTNCISFMRVVLGTGNIGIIGSGMNLKIGGYVLCGLMHIYSGNINDVCPVGNFNNIDNSVLFCSYSWVNNNVIFVYYNNV